MLQQDQFGGRAGGPIVIPGLCDGREQGVLLRQLRRAPRAERDHAESQPPQPGGGGRPLPLRTTGGGVQHGQPATRWRRATASWRRSIRRSASCSETCRNAERPADRAAAIDNNLQRFSFNVPVDDDAALPDGAHRLQPDRQAPVQQRVELQLVHATFRTRSTTTTTTFPGFPVQARSDLGPLQLEQRGAFDADADHGQRSARRLQQRAGHVLQRAQYSGCSVGLGRQTRPASS